MALIQKTVFCEIGKIWARVVISEDRITSIRVAKLEDFFRAELESYMSVEGSEMEGKEIRTRTYLAQNVAISRSTESSAATGKGISRLVRASLHIKNPKVLLR